MPDKGPSGLNFIIFMPDELRADAVHCVDGRGVRTPNTDAFAEQGTAFTRCFVQNPVCSPSRVCFMTGWYPHTRGHRTLYHLLRPEEPNLLKYLKSAGYHVEWHGKNDLLARESFADSVSFRSTDTGTPPWPKNPFPENPFPPGHRLHKSFYFGSRGDGPLEDFDAAQVHNAIRFLKSQPKQPFLLYLPLIFPHPPYTVEEPYFSMYDRNEVPTPLAAKLDDKPHFMREIHDSYALGGLSEEDFREIVATYWGMATRIDHLFGELMDALDSTPLGDRTAVVFTSDHGDYVGDYGLTEKWATGVQDCLIRIPLIIRVPDVTRGRTIGALTEQIDLFPTMMELAGLEPQHTHFGRSLLPLARGETDEHRDAVFAEGGYLPAESQALEPLFPKGTIYHEKTRIQNEDHTTVAKAVMVRTEKWKYVARLAGKEELYDLEADPGELVNRIDDGGLGDVVRDLRYLLLDWFLRTGDVVPFDQDLRW
jgi:arylsulfatase A-like enzyme